MKNYRNSTFFFLSMLLGFSLHSQNSLSGTITIDNIQLAIGARITLLSNDTTIFEETRTDASGYFRFSNIANGTYTLGIALLEMNYEDSVISVSSSINNLDFALEKESHPGEWKIISNSPEPLGGTDLGILLPDGEIFYCHDTKDPFLFDPGMNQLLQVSGDDSVQGCVGPILLNNGQILFVGGTKKEIYGPGTRKVKIYDPQIDRWKVVSGLLDFRWYPSVIPLAEGKILITGGGGLLNPIRVNTTEIYDPDTGTSMWADTTAIGNEVSPIMQLYTGKVLMTHRPPQLFDPKTGQWELASDFVQDNRMPNGDHSDHELVLLPNDDGRVVAIGYISFVHNQPGNLVEIYDPIFDSWSLGANFSPMRSRAKTVLLPNRKILVAGGFKEDLNDSSAINQWGQLFLTDEYDPSHDSWRRLDNLNYAREYHAISMLVPDGRVIMAGGEGKPGNEPPASIIEAFLPPYLFRGIRPSIDSLYGNFGRGGSAFAKVSFADSVTAVRLISTSTLTHFMNSGNNRFVELAFNQIGQEVMFHLPKDSIVLPNGFYMLFVMVDDVPSIGEIIKIDKNVTTSIPDLFFQKSSIELFPNPVSQVLHIKLPVRNSEVVTLTLLTSEGQQVRTGSIERDDMVKMNVFDLAEGIYLLVLTGKTERWVVKVMVRH